MISLSRRTWTIVISTVVTVAALTALFIILRDKRPVDPADPVAAEVSCPADPPMLYGIPYENYTIEDGEVRSGQSLSVLLGRYGIGAADVDRISRLSKAAGFDVRGIRAGHRYTVFLESDSLRNRPVYFVYEQNKADYIVYTLKDTLRVDIGRKDVTTVRRKRSAEIESSLWNCMVDNDISPALSCEMEDVFGWSVDFFGLQKGDRFTVIYDERFIDSVSVGTGRIWGAVFHHMGKDYYAIPFEQDGRITYWDENGKSLRRTLLKAPLKYSRISSRFSYNRMHPVLKIRRPHLGVDYAAPAGTPVVAVADGTVVFRARKGANGNMIKIKHAHNLMTGYLHLRSFAKGIAVGKRVSQGDVIGYVGSTGISTGPHLDYRIWRNGKPIDPLKVTSLPIEPIKESNRARFDTIRDRVLAELRGDVPDSLKVTALALSDTLR